MRASQGLEPGHRMGRYEIVAPLAIGGMGEVYRARDTRLGRAVALKVLPEERARDPERLARFEQEARTIARLSHPNVLTIFDVGCEAHRLYLVFELLEGMTLRTRLEASPIGVAEALALAARAARGLAAAHAQGIVHRDFKPENCFLTRAGELKLLDFGIARARGPRPAGEAAATDEFLTSPLAALGTPHYMSPEQLRRDPLDGRSDVFALGTVLFEMLAGRHPWRRASDAETVAAILREDAPELPRLGARNEDALASLVRRCLAKRADERFQSASDLAAALEVLGHAERAPFEPRPLASAPTPGADPANPYPGLRAFTRADADCFFGRELDTAALWSKLREQPLLAVIGPSGVGKSSFLHAGVTASLPTGWSAALVTPGRQPVTALAQALAPHLAGDAAALARLVSGVAQSAAGRRASEWLPELFAAWRARAAGALLVVDQFEELFTLHTLERRSEVAELLARIVEARVHVLLSVRDDFFFRCSEHAELLPVFEHVTPVGVPPRSSLRRALTEPAARLGVRFEDEALVEAMLDAVEGERGALPLLGFAVARLWETRDRERGRLTRAAFEAMGGVAGAIAQHAEATLQRIGAAREPLVRDLFRALVTAQGTRAAAERSELLGAFPGDDSARAVLDELIAARLLTAYDEHGAGAAATGQRIEIIHESLLRAWPRLVRWHTQDAEELLYHEQLRQAAQAWERRGRSPDLLWTGTAYRELELWRERAGGRLSRTETQFADAMRAQSERRTRFARGATLATVFALLLLSAFIERSRRGEAAARGLAEARRLVALGGLELDADPTAALAYARRSLELQDSAAARSLAVEALWRGPMARVASSAEPCSELAASPDGRWLACGSWPRPASTGDAAGTVELELAPQSGRGGAAADRWAVVWSIEGKRLERAARLSVTWAAASGYRLEVAVDGDGAAAGARPEPSVSAAASSGLWAARDAHLFQDPGSAAGGAPRALAGSHSAPVVSASVHEPTGAFVSVDEGREVRVWSGRPPRLRHERQGLDPGLLSFPSLDAAGEQLVWRSVAERALVLWDLSGPPDAEPLLMRRRSLGGHVGDGSFVGRERWVAAVIDGSLTLWPTGVPWPRRLRGHAAAVVEARFAPDGRHLVSCGTDGARLWPLAPGLGRARPVELGRVYTCYGAAWDGAGARVAVAAPSLGVYVAPLERGAPVRLVDVPRTAAVRAVAVSPDGRYTAGAVVTSAAPEERRLHVFDRAGGRLSSHALPGARLDSPDSGGVYALRFLGPALLSVGDAGLLRWDLATGRFETLLALGCGTVAASADGRRVVVGCLSGEAGSQPGGPSSRVFALDAGAGGPKVIGNHGDTVQAVAVDASGRMLATGDNAGLVRVSGFDGGEPHLLFGARGVVASLDFSPDGQWIAAAVGNDVWLWPVPDVSRAPLQALPRGELAARLDAFTNQRVVEDAAAATGFRSSLGPFTGWRAVPQW